MSIFIYASCSNYTLYFSYTQLVNSKLHEYTYPNLSGRRCAKKLNGSKIAVQRYKIQYKIGIFFPTKSKKVSFKYKMISSTKPIRSTNLLHSTLSASAKSHTTTKG